MRKLLRYGSRVALRATGAALRPLTNRMPESGLARLHRRVAFRAVYRRGEWGGDGRSRFFSGVGSHGEAAAKYADTMSAILADLARQKQGALTIVDLGCGDFSVGSQLLARLPPVRYVGCDVVPELVRANQQRYGSDRIAFRLIDMVSDELPPGDVCTVRQVFQHLPNADILCVLTKLRRYERVFVTEGQPVTRQGPVNPDKTSNGDVRFDWRSGCGRGVELDQPPYGLPVEEICRVQPPWPGKEVIVTYRVDFSATPRPAR